jgi:hypothetical protein
LTEYILDEPENVSSERAGELVKLAEELAG